MNNILYCDTRGNKDFSAFYAKVEIFGIYQSIEDHYQLAKRFGDFVPKHWKEAKRKKVTHFVVNGISFNPNLLSAYYKLLWVKYLDQHPHLVSYAKQFDTFVDRYVAKDAFNSQAEVIEKYVKYGRKSILQEEDCRTFSQLLRNHKVY